jgi:hypothetical protein
MRVLEKATTPRRFYLGRDMLPVVRIYLYLFIVALLVAPSFARAQRNRDAYARLLTREEIREALHCPFCNYSASDDPIYFVQTSENLNLAFTELDSAIDAVELLNEMTRAKNHCDTIGYKAAFANYVTVFGKEVDPDTAMDMNGVFKLLQPQRNTLSLLEYVVPSFRPCGTRPLASARANVGGTKRGGLRWSYR